MILTLTFLPSEAPLDSELEPQAVRVVRASAPATATAETRVSVRIWFTSS